MSLQAAQTSTFALEDLRLLIAIGESGSLSSAARRLHLNHTSAWRRLGALEKRLGVRLFHRDRSGYSATLAGEEAWEVAEQLLSQLDRLERRLSGQDVRPSGVVRITTAETLLNLIAPVVASLRVSHPGIVVELSATNAFLTLTRREADIAVRPAAERPAGLVARRLGTIASAVYGSPTYLAGRDTDPFAMDWLAPDESLSHLGSARWMARNVAPERVVHRAGSLIVLAMMARTGIGVAPLPCFLADQDNSLVRVLPPITEMATSLWLITHPDLRKTARMRVALDALHLELGRKNRQLMGANS